MYITERSVLVYNTVMPQKERWWMTKKWVVVISVFVFFVLVNPSTWGWCEPGADVGNYQLALTSARICDNHCVKSEVEGKMHSFTSSGLGQSTSCAARPRVYCGNTFVTELHDDNDYIACPVGTSIQIGYDSGCTELQNHLEGIITIAESGPIPPPISPESHNYRWIAWTVAGVVMVAVVTTVICYKHRHRSSKAAAIEMMMPNPLQALRLGSFPEKD